MNKLIVVLILMLIISICSGCGHSIKINKDGKIAQLEKYSEVINYIESISDLGEFSDFCYLNGITYPIKNPYTNIVLDKNAVPLWDQYSYLRRVEYASGKENTIIANSIRNNKICLGMTREDVMFLYGNYYYFNINRSVGSWGVHEQWVYNDAYGRKYFYFKNNILTSWQY